MPDWQLSQSITFIQSITVYDCSSPAHCILVLVWLGVRSSLYLDFQDLNPFFSGREKKNTRTIWSQVSGLFPFVLLFSGGIFSVKDDRIYCCSD